MKDEVQTPETPALANLIDRAAMIEVYRADLAVLESRMAEKRAEYLTYKAKAEVLCELRDEARDILNVVHGQATTLRQLITYHEAPAPEEG